MLLDRHLACHQDVGEGKAQPWRRDNLHLQAPRMGPGANVRTEGQRRLHRGWGQGETSLAASNKDKLMLDAPVGT